MYPIHVALTLLGMITAGAGRIVAVKIYFQIELEESRPVTPLFVTALYLVGQALSLIVHCIYIQLKNSTDPQQKDEGNQTYATIEFASRTLNDHDSIPSLRTEFDDDQNRPIENELVHDNGKGKGETPSMGDKEEQIEGLLICNDYDDDDEHHQSSTKEPTTISSNDNFTRRKLLKRRGSKTGLTEESKDAVAWIHNIPWYLKPVIPGFFNLCNSALRWACLVYVAASTAEILISGLELVFSSFAARIIRKRIISKRRWMGVSFVTLGIVLVGFAKVVENKDSESEEEKFLIGNLLIFGQCVFSVLQDLSEEIFMQEANFPATLLLGMEGLFGLVFGLPIYLLFFSEEISSTRVNIGYEIGLVFLVLITGILNIRTTEVTSSMTRNVWKQFRIILVWVLGLLVYYIGSSDRLGEAWINPDSFFVLGGFSIILTGVYFYYSQRRVAQ